MSGPRGAADGVRHLARDVQRFGLLSATTVVERYVDLVDRALGGPPTQPFVERPSSAGADGDATALVDSVARLAETYLGLLDAATRLVGPSPSSPGLVMTPVEPGGRSDSALWVHNSGTELTRAVTVTMSPLVSADGACIDATSARCTPARLTGIAAGGSAQLNVAVDVPFDQRPGVYHGLVLVSLAAEEPMPVALEVLEP